MDHIERVAARRFEDTRFNPLRPRGRRRTLVVAWVGLTLATTAVIAAGDPIANVVAIVGGAAGVWLLRVVVRSVVDLPDEVLDERQVATTTGPTSRPTSSSPGS